MTRRGISLARFLGVSLTLGSVGAPAALAQVSHAPATPAATCTPCDTTSLLRGLPGDTEAVLVIANAARQRTSAAGRSLQGLFRDAGALPETGAAWERLAAALDWSSDQAFDELLGRRVTLVVRGLSRAAEPDWAILSDVSASTERRMRERLAASPRGTCSGLPVLAVEDGAFELTIARSPSLKTDGAGLATIVLSPGPRAAAPSTLVQELALSDYVRSQGALPGEPRARPCEIVLMLRSSGDAGAAVRTLMLTAVSREDGWQARLVSSPGMVWDVPSGRDLDAWSDAPFQAMAADCLLGMMGVVGAAPTGGIRSIHGLEHLLPAVPDVIARPAGARRAALVLRRLTLEGPPRTPGVPDRRAILASGKPPPRAALATHPALSLTVALESSDERALIVDGDHAIANTLCILQGGQGAAASVCMELDAPDGSPRRIRLEDDVTIAEAYRAPLERLFGPGAELTWGACARTAARAGSPRTAWWSATLAPAGAAALTRTAPAAAPGAARPAEARRRVSVGVVRPAELDRTLRALDTGPGFFAPLAPMRWVDTVRWDSWLRDDGMIEADVDITMRR